MLNPKFISLILILFITVFSIVSSIFKAKELNEIKDDDLILDIGIKTINKIKNIIKENSKSEILELLDYSSDNLVESIRVNTESAINNKTLTIQEARKLIDQIETSLRKSSYLSE